MSIAVFKAKPVVGGQSPQTKAIFRELRFGYTVVLIMRIETYLRIAIALEHEVEQLHETLKNVPWI